MVLRLSSLLYKQKNHINYVLSFPVKYMTVYIHLQEFFAVNIK